MTRASDDPIGRAAEAIHSARALIIGAGAGMGVDSGLPDFRGRDGFWRAYPIAERLGLSFAEMANPRWFRHDPAFAWGFYGHRLNLYRTTEPHPGFAILRRWVDRMPLGAFVLTSNVDGQFQRAGFGADRIVEVHGRINRLQCSLPCGAPLFDADPNPLVIDPHELRAAEPLPRCPVCGAISRPNILMFGDFAWDASETDVQERRLASWLLEVGEGPVALVECGAGTSVPTIRLASERIAERLGGTLIRINPRDFEVPPGHIGLPFGAREGLEVIDRLLAQGR